MITKRVSFSTKGNTDIVDLTPLIGQELDNSDISDGIISVFVPGATGGVTTIEYEPGLIKDFKEVVERLIPRDKTYQHNLRWADENAHSHLGASLIGPELTVPFSDRQLLLGTWQQIVFVDFDIRPRNRTVILQILGGD